MQNRWNQSSQPSHWTQWTWSATEQRNQGYDFFSPKNGENIADFDSDHSYFDLFSTKLSVFFGENMQKIANIGSDNNKCSKFTHNKALSNNIFLVT
jgi:hypothetical protein